MKIPNFEFWTWPVSNVANMNGAGFIQFNSRYPREGDQDVFDFIISEPQLIIYLLAECPRHYESSLL